MGSSDFFLALEWVGMVYTLVAIYFMAKIGQITGWFKAWMILFLSFVLIIVRRIISAYALISPEKVLLGQINSVLLFVLGILYAMGFYMLYKIFKANNKKV